MPAEWLSLSKVAHILGVHPSTVRNWSDQGLMPVHRTEGGHRRYLRSEVELWMQSRRADSPGEMDTLMQNALRSTRFHIGDGRLQQEAWYQKLDGEAREQYRLSGRTLLQGMIRYMSSDDRSAAAEADAIGSEYASRGRRCGLNSVDATHAFLFFRNLLMDSMMKVYEASAVSSPQAWSDMLRKSNEFTDRILISLLEKYEALQRNNR